MRCKKCRPSNRIVSYIHLYLYFFYYLLLSSLIFSRKNKCPNSNLKFARPMLDHNDAFGERICSGERFLHSHNNRSVGMSHFLNVHGKFLKADAAIEMVNHVELFGGQGQKGEIVAFFSFAFSPAEFS